MVNNRKLKFKTETGLTRFRYEQVAAITERDDSTVEVHLCSGTIFTIHEQYSERFIDWYEFSQQVKG